MRLEGDRDAGGVGELGRRDAVEADRGRDLGHVHRGGDRQRAAHAEAHDAHARARRCQVPGSAPDVLVRRAREVEPRHQVVRLVGLLSDAALVQVGREGGVAGAREPVGHAADLVVQAPPLLDDDDGRPSGAGLGQVAAGAATVRPLEFDASSHRRSSSWWSPACGGGNPVERTGSVPGLARAPGNGRRVRWSESASPMPVPGQRPRAARHASCAPGLWREHRSPRDVTRSGDDARQPCA